MSWRRRRVLAALAAGSLAGCQTRLPSGNDATRDRDGDHNTAATVDAPSLAETGRPADVCEQEVRDSDIVAIADPAFDAAWPDPVPDGYRPLADEDVVVGVAAGGEARAYPLSLLARHEIVNDHLDGPLLVTFCPLCRSGLVASRRVAGEPTTFDVSGLLWQPPRIQVAASEADGRVFSDRESGVSPTRNLVMVDAATGSYWSQILARAICGPQAGTALDVRPSTVTTWGDWRASHDDATVLLPPPHSGLTRPEDAPRPEQVTARRDAA
jgi:hypothetical protein